MKLRDLPDIGIVGRTIAAKLAFLGHEVVIGTRGPSATLTRTEAGAMGTPSFATWHAAHPRWSCGFSPKPPPSARGSSTPRRALSRSTP